jgi:lysophospholipase L1-like esterase
MGEALEAVRVEIREWKEAMRMTVFKGEDGDDGGDDQGTDPSSHLYLVLCAGENDIGLGVPLEDTVERLSSLFDVLRDASVGLVDAADGDQTTSAAPSGHQECAAGAVVSIVLLGPKLEPWLAGDVESRKQYIRMSRALESRCKAATDNARAETAKQLLRVLFVDCLTMFFFPDSISRPGALLGGRAVPDSSYFDKDQLHLNERGYLVWKRVAEEALLSVGWGQSDCHVPR